jgi:hypothetical protein
MRILGYATGSVLFMFTLVTLFIMSTKVTLAAGFDDYLVIDSKAAVKIPVDVVLKKLEAGKTCVKHRNSVKLKSPNLTKADCTDKDHMERYGISVIKCSNILETDFATKCKGMKPIK